MPDTKKVMYTSLATVGQRRRIRELSNTAVLKEQFGTVAEILVSAVELLHKEHSK